MPTLFGDKIETTGTTAFGDTTGIAVEDRDFLEDFILSDTPIEQWLPEEQAGVAQQILDSFDKPDDERARISNAVMLSDMFGIPLNTSITMQPEMMEKMYGKQLTATAGNVKLKQEYAPIKEIPENLYIGAIGLTASALEAVKARGIQLIGGGIFPDDEVRRLFEPITPVEIERTDRLFPDADFNPFNRTWRERRLPGAIAAEAVGLVTRLPDIAAKLLRKEQERLSAEQWQATWRNAPITKAFRVVLQSGVPSMTAAIGVSILTGNPVVGLVLLGETERGAAFQEQLEAGGSIRKAQIIGDLSSAAEIGGEMLVFPKLLKGVTKGISLKEALVLVAENATQEGVTGFTQRFLEVFGKETTKGTTIGEAANLAFNEGIKAIPENAFVGGVTAGLVDITSAGVQGASQLGRKIEDGRITEPVIVKPAAKEVSPEAEVPPEGITVPPKAPAAAVKPVGAKVPTEGKVEKFFHGTPFEGKTKFAEKEGIIFITKDRGFAENIADEQTDNLMRKFETEAGFHPTILEVEADLNLFDINNPEHRKALLKKLPETFDTTSFAGGKFKTTKAEFVEAIEKHPKNTWTMFELDVKDNIKELGFDGWKQTEKGTETIGVFDSKKLEITAQPPTAKEPAIIVPEQIQKGKPFKPVSKEGPGLTKAEQEVLTVEQQERLRFKQAQGEKAGFKAGEKASQERAKTEILKLKKAQKMTEGRRKTAVELVKAFVEKENRGDFLKRISVAKTPRDIEKITEAIEKGVVRAEKKLAIGNLKKAAKAISPKRMLPEFAETAKKILDSIQIGKIRPETIVKNTELKEMAQQVLDTAREDSVAAFQAQQLLEELRGKTAKTFAINQLSVEAIDQITDTLVALRFQNEADTIAAKDENATEAVRRRKEIKKGIVEAPEVSESLGGKQLKKFKLFHDNLESALDAVAGARAGTYDLWIKDKKATTEFIYDKLNKGVDDQIVHNEKARNIFRQILADNEVTQKDILNWSMRPEDVSLVKKAFGIAPKPEVHTFTLKDAKGKATEFEFTVNELMSIFMHSRNSHNLSVLLNDGMDRFVKGKKQKIRDFTVEVIDDMIDALSVQQKKVARQVGSKLMDGFNKNSLNETSVRLEFFELAKVENYWPARRSIIRTPRGKQVAGAVKTVEGMGLLKERVGVGNPMRLSGFFETTYSTNKNVATYVGLAEPLREVKSVYTTDVIESMENSGRAEEAKLITDLIVRFEDQSALLGPLDTIIKRMLGGFAKAKLFLNLKIAPRQQISSFLVSAYVDTKYIAEFRGLASKEDIAEVIELSPQTRARFENLQFDRDIGDAFMQNELMNYLTGETTLIDKTALGMRFFDRNAIVDIYRAVKAEVIDKGVDINSKDGKALLKDRFEWVIRHTQPMWHPKDRSLIGSDPRPLVRSLTMFMSQREQLVRMVNNGITDYVNSEKTVEDATRLGRSIGAVTLSMTAFTLYNFAWALLIHKKKRDVLDLAKSFFKDILSLPFFGKYIAKSFEIVFNILTDKPVFRQSFDEGPIEGILGRILIEAIPNFARAATHYTTGEKYKSGPNKGEEKWKNELLVATDALVDAIASLKGIPYYGAKDIARSVKAQLPENEKKAVIILGE